MGARRFLCEWLLFKDPFPYCSYVVLVIRERMDVHHWWNDIDTGELQYFEENLSQCSVSSTNPTWIEPEPTR